MHHCNGLPQIPLEIELQHGFLGHEIDCNPKVNQGVEDYNIVNFHINYSATRIQVLWGDYYPQHQFKQLSNNIDSGGICSSSLGSFETILIDKIVVNGDIFDGLEKGYFDTRVL